jgi:putative ABC transport system permease protein
MYLLMEGIRSALASVRAHRLRSFLTSLGIVVGVASVITIISLIQGMSVNISRQFEGLGGNGLVVRAHQEYKDILRGKINYLRFEDIDQVAGHVDGIREMCPVFYPGSTEVRHAGRSGYARVTASTPAYQDVQQRYVVLGRFISASDEANARRVAVIGEKLIETLHLKENPVGQFIQFSKEWFKIIGVIEKRGEIFGMSQDDLVIIPFKTGRSIIGNDRQPQIEIHISMTNIERSDAMKRQISAVIRKSHRLGQGQADDFEVQSADQLAKTFDKLSNMVTLVMSGIVGIALLVGGIGIMNIMLVSVTERTREIGICKALGARNKDILLQFLVEAVLLSAMGGLIGVALGYAMGAGLAKLLPDFPDAFVPLWAIVASLLFSSGIGIVFGVVPASNAAKLDPIEALRYE